jgi:hypothetical protein
MSTLSIPRHGQIEHPHTNGETAQTTETAEQYFVRSLLSLPGVLEVVPPEVSRRDAGWFEVHIAKSDQELEYAVYDLELETHRRYPMSMLMAMVLSPTGY